MKFLIALISLVAFVPSTYASDGHHWRPPARYSDHYDRGSRTNPWPFIAGAVVGGIIVNEMNRPPVVVKPQPEPPVLVNGVWMQRVYQCTQNIVADRFGNESLVNRCNWVFVPVQTQLPFPPAQ